jgi:hypothetical protein
MIRLLKRTMGDPESLLYTDEQEEALEDEEDYPVAKRAAMVRLLRSAPSMSDTRLYLYFVNIISQYF